MSEQKRFEKDQWAALEQLWEVNGDGGVIEAKYADVVLYEAVSDHVQVTVGDVEACWEAQQPMRGGSITDGIIRVKGEGTLRLFLIFYGLLYREAVLCSDCAVGDLPIVSQVCNVLLVRPLEA